MLGNLSDGNSRSWDGEEEGSRESTLGEAGAVQQWQLGFAPAAGGGGGGGRGGLTDDVERQNDALKVAPKRWSE